MKILYHHRTQAEDGQAVHIRALIDAFEALGHEVLEVSLVKRAAVGAGNGREGAGRSRWGWVTRLPRFARELAEYGYNGLARQALMKEAAFFAPDFLYERYAFGNAAGVLAARRLKKPLVLEVNSPMVVELSRTRGLSFPGLARKLEDHVFRSADRVCVVTGVLRDMLIEQGVQPERLLVTPNGVDLALYDGGDPAERRRAARRELGLPRAREGEEEPLVLGFVGYFREWHRLDVCLRALEHPALANAVLVLVGQGPVRSALEREAAERGVADRLFLCGSRPHSAVPGLLPAFDVGLIPAINPYASPLKLHEYMAARLAVIAPDQPNLREVLTPDEDALLVAPGDAEAMSDALVRLAEDAALRSRLGTAARATLERRELTWQANARRVIAAVKELC